MSNLKIQVLNGVSSIFFSVIRQFLSIVKEVAWSLTSKANALSNLELSKSKSITVIYLARGNSEDELESIDRFIDSYKKFDSGETHKLHVILKGFRNTKDLQKYKAKFLAINCEFSNQADKGFDIGSYFECIKKIDSDYVMVINTHTRFQAENWLKKLCNVVSPMTGIIGCTASYESLIALSSKFPAFPNPHVRTNGILISRKLFLEFCTDFAFETKMDAWEFESGVNSLTAKSKKAGLNNVIVGRNGRPYKEDEWPRSGTFRSGGQRNLLIADNQTLFYKKSSMLQRLKMSHAAWGRFI